MQAHPDRPWSRRPRVGQLYTFNSIQAARCFHDDGFHDDLHRPMGAQSRTFGSAFMALVIDKTKEKRA